MATGFNGPRTRKGPVQPWLPRSVKSKHGLFHLHTTREPYLLALVLGVGISLQKAQLVRVAGLALAFTSKGENLSFRVAACDADEVSTCAATFAEDPANLPLRVGTGAGATC